MFAGAKVNKSVKAPDSGAVANIRSMYEDDKSLSTIKFARDSKNTEPYVFQNLKGISMVSNTRLSNVMVKTSDDGVNYHDLESLVVNTYDDSLNAYTGSLVFSEIIRDSYFMLEQVSEPVLNANIKRLVLSYSCDNSYIPPVKHSISTAPTENGSVNIDTTRKHVKGETVNFNVQPASGYIVSDVYTVPETALSVSGFNYSFEMPEDDVSIHASFELAPLVAYNVSAQASSGGSVSFSRTQYYENESVAFTVTPNSTYEIDSVSTSPSLAVSGSAGSYSFTMPASDVEVAVSYKQVSSLSFSGDYQTEFGVGDTFNHDNLVVTANYVDGSSKVVTDYSISSPDMSIAGSKTITVTYNGVSNTYSIDVTAPDAIERIEISGTYKTNYHFNDTVDHTGVVVNAVYTSGNKVDVTSDCTFTDPSMSSWTILGKKVTVHYLTFSATYNIKIFTLNSISLSGQYSSTNTTFNYGNEYSLKGITAEATYKCTYDGGTDTMYEDVTSQVTCSGYNMSSVSNSQTVTVTYNDGHDSASTTYTIKVNDVLDHISYVAGTGAKTTYKVGEIFDKTGFVIYKHMKSGAQSDVTSDATFNAPAFSEEGNYNVVVSFPGVESINIPVIVEKGEDPSSDFSGVFRNGTYDPYKFITFNTNGSGDYTYGTGNTINFTWLKNSSVITIIPESGYDETNFGSGKIFFGKDSITVTLASDESKITVKMGSNEAFASDKPFTKQ